MRDENLAARWDCGEDKGEGGKEKVRRQDIRVQDLGVLLIVRETVASGGVHEGRLAVCVVLFVTG